jgi:Tfp pilus assembly protein PilN
VLRTNLSTRPFYNERAIHMLLGAAAVLVLGLTVYNVVRIVSLSRQNTEFAAQTNREHQEAERLIQQAAEIRRTVNKEELSAIVEAATEANALIDQRTFSWTEFFNQIEITIPPDVMLTSVRPSVRSETTVVGMSMLGRRAEDIDEFVEKLEATGGFTDCLIVRQDMTEAGLYQVAVNCTYTGAFEEAPPEPGAEPAPSPPEGTPKPPVVPERGRA